MFIYIYISKIKLIYVGRGGFDMIPAVTLLFKAFRSLLDAGIQSAQNIRFHFIGTSYAPQGRGSLTFTPIAKSFDLEEFVSERTDRVSFYESILSMQAADGLLIPGSNDPGYTASKIYPYLLTGKPILGLFRSTSSAYHILKKASHIVTDFDNQEQALLDVKRYLTKSITGELSAFQNCDDSEDYAAKNMTKQQCELFDSICSKK